MPPELFAGSGEMPPKVYIGSGEMPPKVYTGSGEILPALYRDSGEALMERISALAASYTPEWRFNPSEPDMGTALTCMYARILEHSMEECNEASRLWYRDFMEAAGCRVKEAAPARGYMAFGLVKPDMPEILLPKGWGVVCSGKDGSVAMETEEEVYVSAASVNLSVLPGEQGRNGACGSWLLAFDRPVNKGVISILFSMDGNWETSVSGLVWEYYGKNGWTFLAVRDGTEGLGHTGIVSFAGTSDFVPMEGEALSGWGVRIRSGQDGGRSGEDRGRSDEKKAHPGKGKALPDTGGTLPLHLPQVFMNAAPVAAREPGTMGNIEPWTKSRLKKTVGFVSVIRNPGSFYGGREEEGREEALARTAARFRHQFRAVTPGDYEHLVREVCPDAEKVRCFTGFDRNGKKRWGAVTVVVLFKDFMTGQPYFFRIKEQLHEYFRDREDGLLARESGCGIVPPLFVRMDVRAVLCVRSHGEVMEVGAVAQKEMERFLHPLDGGYDGNGWDMGMIPDHSQLKNRLQHVPGVFYVRQLACQCFVGQNGGWQETEWEQAAFFPWSLPVPGKCLVDVEVG